MREAHLPYLSDPITNAPFQILKWKEADGHIISGLLLSGTEWYPIINSIPRILLGKLKTNTLQARQTFFEKYKGQMPEHVRVDWQRAIDDIPDLDAFLKHQKKTAESFAYEWKHIYRENNFEKQNFLHFLSPFVKEQDLRGKLTLDIGCGSGRFTKWSALSGAEIAFGSDLGESVEVAYQMTYTLPNVCIVQSDIYAMPFKNVFDLAYSIGVLHHLPEPQKGFLKLPRVLKQGGKMLIWVYNRRDNARALYFYEPLRATLRHLPKPLLFKLCYIPGMAVHFINLFGKGLSLFGLGGLAQRMPFAYYMNFPFNMKLNDAFDVLATPKSNYYKVEEIGEWFYAAKLKHVDAYEHKEAGITCVGIYEH